jgi:hypothetical protein
VGVGYNMSISIHADGYDLARGFRRKAWGFWRLLFPLVKWEVGRRVKSPHFYSRQRTHEYALPLLWTAHPWEEMLQQEALIDIQGGTRRICFVERARGMGTLWYPSHCLMMGLNVYNDVTEVPFVTSEMKPDYHTHIFHICCKQGGWRALSTGFQAGLLCKSNFTLDRWRPGQEGFCTASHASVLPLFMMPPVFGRIYRSPVKLILSGWPNESCCNFTWIVHEAWCSANERSQEEYSRTMQDPGYAPQPTAAHHNT